MQVIVSGKQVDVGESLRNHIEEKVRSDVSKYSDRINTITVVVSKQGHSYRIDISGNIGTHAGLLVKSRREGTDPYGAADLAVDKIAKQVRRYKRQLTDHHPAHAPEKPSAVGLSCTEYVVSGAEPEESAGADASDNPVIIAEKDAIIDHLSVSEAVMRMDLGELPALVFVNRSNNRVNTLYRRHDRHIVWVDPDTERTHAGHAA
mgnify:CR=1 FL=1